MVHLFAPLTPTLRLTRKAIAAWSGAVALCALAGGGWYAAEALPVGVGHKAKTLCSGVFVSGLHASVVLSALQTEGLEVLRHIDASVDSKERAVSASFLGAFERRAVYRDGLGCTLVLDGREPPALKQTQLVRKASPPSGEVSAGVYPGLEDAIARAFAEPDPAQPRRTLAVVVMHRGRVISERYAGGASADTPMPGWSMTKSVVNALVGILVGDGRLSVGASALLPEWRSDARSAITLDHLLRMSSGLRSDERAGSVFSDVTRMLFRAADTAAFAAGKELEAAPGTRWQYSSGTTNIVSRVIRSAIGDDAEYLTFPRRALFDRLGMSSAVLETDAAGTFVGSSYMFATARDWARFGTLYSQDGVWNGERILPEGWVAYTSTPAPAGKHYGAHFSLEVPLHYAGGDHRLPAKALHAVGHEGQFLTIVPSRELVIVRLGRTRHRGVWDHARFVRDVLAAVPALR